MDESPQILEAKGDIKAAIPVLQKGAILDPESRAIQQVNPISGLVSRRN